MKKYYLINTLILIFGLLLISCDSDYGMPEPYTPYMEDAPDYSPKVYINNQVPPINQFSFTAIYVEKENIIRVEGDSISKFSVKMTSPATEKMVVKLAIDEKYIEEYNQKNETDYILMSKDYYVMNSDEAIIEAGKKESEPVTIAVKLGSAQVQQISKPLMLPLKIVSVNGKTEGISENLQSIAISGKVNLVLDNIDSSNPPIDGTPFNEGIELVSDNPYYLENLTDGVLDYGNWWPYSQTYLEIHLPKEELIKGIIINTGLGYYQLGSVNVTSQGSSGNVTQGTFSTKESGEEFYLKFKRPMSVKMIRLSNFLTTRGSAYPDVFEVRLVK